jgi:hypothetical protein
MHLRSFIARSKSVQKCIIAAIALIGILDSCGGGGGSSPSPSSPTAAPTEKTVSKGASAWLPISGGLFNSFVVNWLVLSVGSDAYSVYFYNFFKALPTTSSQEVISYSLSVGNASPQPPVAGNVISYIQFQVGPASIVMPQGESLQMISETDVSLGDPLHVPQGAYVECSVYAGSQLIGSGSNAQIAELETGPGSICNTANHGNSEGPAPGFKFPALQAGTVYTIVYSVLN